MEPVAILGSKGEGDAFAFLNNIDVSIIFVMWLIGLVSSFAVEQLSGNRVPLPYVLINPAALGQSRRDIGITEIISATGCEIRQLVFKAIP